MEIRGGLSPWSTYELRVSAANLLGYGPPSLPSPQTNTLISVPDKVPANITGGEGNNGDLTIRWVVSMQDKITVICEHVLEMSTASASARAERAQYFLQDFLATTRV